MTKEEKLGADRRTSLRQSLRVPFRLSTAGRAPQIVDGETIDVSASGLGVKFSSRVEKLDTLLETLVEDRLSVEIMLRLPEGSVSTQGQVVWWGLLGDDDKFGIRAGILLPSSWSDSDWLLIEKNLV
ncbi:MAG TPA: PilZ domain-containing protein [Candidatus Binatia bacterium]|nr:PilZ domain-containing protein [Candidatus Binatia bacterium]